MFSQDGIVTRQMFQEKLPSAERRKKGPYVVMECFQNIPCNPCSTNCPFGAVKKMDNLNDLPRNDIDKCSGCGKCIAVCPGLACFVIDETYPVPGKILMKLPYELSPLPSKGQVVKGLGRAGNPIADVRVMAVQAGKQMDKTAVITIELDEKFLYDVRSIQVEEG